MAEHSTSTRLAAEALGSFFLFLGVIGSGIMAEQLAGGNIALALLANSIATGAILYVIIVTLGPLSGAHFNPAVTFAFALRREIDAGLAAAYVAVQLASGALGAWCAHLMFEQPIWQLSETVRSGVGQWSGELVATFGLVLFILLGVRLRPQAVPAIVGAYIAGAYWFTSSTSFANPAITVVRSLTDSFAGIAWPNVPLFVVAQFAGAVLAVGLARFLLREA